MRSFLIISIFFCFFYSAGQNGKPLKVGEESKRVIESPHPYNGSISGNYEVVWSDRISEKNASYIAVHFKKFSLSPDDYIVIRDPENTRAWKYHYGEEDRKQFWSIHIYGSEAIIEIFSKNKVGGYGYKIDKIAKGFVQNDEINMMTITEQEALCGPDDSQEAACYETSEPFVYEKSKAVARLLINGTSACTGWLIGDDGHLMTNEHCISSASQANNVTVEFMAEGSSCSTDCRDWLECAGTIVATSTAFIKSSSNLDYSLLQLPTNVTSTYGFLQLRETGPVQGERIYIPQHPQAWGKRIALNSTDSHETGGLARVFSLNEPRCNGTGSDIGYYADTQPGSSGSPVIGYEDNLVIALHHCGACPNRGVSVQEIINDLGNDLPNNALQSPIMGTETICYSTNGSSYSLQGVGSANSWQVSSNLQILSSSSTSVTVRPANSSVSGYGYIKAVLSSQTFQKDVVVGAPKPSSFLSVLVDPYLGRIKARVEPVENATGYEWYLDGVLYTHLNYPINGDYVTMSIPKNDCTVRDYSIGVKAITPCGTSQTYYELHDNPCYQGDYYYSYSPNPTSETLTIERMNIKTVSASSQKEIAKSFEHDYKFYDFQGNLIFRGKLENKITLDVSNLVEGRYILEIQMGVNEKEVHHIQIN
ncbi:trypsin-like peptidase domain-containing protein [Salinimicrobium flavum]|uniref:Trypsin-like peptidase domain-containing protein n=1 Tax=Salinimicrobium flavum TaxID=1737065 RepID=A0ABW5IXZ5_9FLAO